jgi:hypothetical protein
VGVSDLQHRGKRTFYGLPGIFLHSDFIDVIFTVFFETDLVERNFYVENQTQPFGFVKNICVVMV